MKDTQITEMMQHISPRYTEEAAARAAKAKPRFSLMGAAGVLAGAVMCTAVIGGAVYMSRNHADKPEIDSQTAAENSIETAVTTTAQSAEQIAEQTDVTAPTKTPDIVFTDITDAPEQSITSLISSAQNTAHTTTGSTTAAAKSTTAATAATKATTVSTAETKQTTADTVSNPPKTYQLGDVDMDGYVTYADFFLLHTYMFSENYAAQLNVPAADYPLKLTAEQLALAAFVSDPSEGVQTADYLQFKKTVGKMYQSDADNQPVDTSSFPAWGISGFENHLDYFSTHPEYFTGINDFDKYYAENGRLTGLFMNIMEKIPIYIHSLYGQPTCLTKEYFDADMNRCKATSPELYMNDAQFDQIIAFMRRVCIERTNEGSLTARIKSLTSDGCIVLFENHSKDTVAYYGPQYEIYRAEDGTLCEPTEPPVFQCVINQIPAGGSAEIEFSWYEAYGKLPAGSYYVLLEAKDSSGNPLRVDFILD